MLYSMQYNVCSLVILAAVMLLFFRKKQLPIFQNKIFGVLLCTNLISIVFDILCCIGSSYPHLVSREFQMFSNLFYFVVRGVIVCLFVLYAISLSGRYKNIPQEIKVTIYIPLAIEFLCILLTPKYKIIFWIDENNRYVRSGGIAIIYLIMLYYLIFVGVYTFLYRRVIAKRVRNSVIMFFALSLIPVGIQYFFPQLVVEGFGITMCLLMMYLTVQNPEELLDGETNLLNEQAFTTMIPGTLAIKEKFWLVIVMVDDIPLFNHMFGISLVKDFLQKIALFLKECAGKKTLYRIAPCKFCMIVDKNEKGEIEKFLKQIKERFEQPWKQESGQVKFSVKLCVIECPKEAKTLEEILDYIEALAFHKKTKEVMKIAELENTYRRRLNEIKRAIKEALEENKFEVYYQPIYSTKEKKIQSAEALLRLYDKKLGWISPEEFIPVAEQTGQILKIGKFVLDSVCRFWEEYSLEEKGLSYVEINLSVQECMQDNLSSELKEILKKYNVKPGQINLEITETEKAYSLEIFKNNMKEVKKQGFDLALDDYGTGYSTMSYLINLPFRFVKMDKSIVWEAFSNEKAAGLIQNVIKTIHALDMELIAEGVETKEQMDALTEWGCELLQGYYFSKPIPEKEFLELLEKF